MVGAQQYLFTDKFLDLDCLVSWKGFSQLNQNNTEPKQYPQ